MGFGSRWRAGLAWVHLFRTEDSVLLGAPRYRRQGGAGHLAVCVWRHGDICRANLPSFSVLFLYPGAVRIDTGRVFIQKLRIKSSLS